MNLGRLPQVNYISPFADRETLFSNQPWFQIPSQYHRSKIITDVDRLVLIFCPPVHKCKQIGV